MEIAEPIVTFPDNEQFNIIEIYLASEGTVVSREEHLKRYEVLKILRNKEKTCSKVKLVKKELSNLIP